MWIDVFSRGKYNLQCVLICFACLFVLQDTCAELGVRAETGPCSRVTQSQSGNSCEGDLIELLTHIMLHLSAPSQLTVPQQ